jgi:hypothetical protein
MLILPLAQVNVKPSMAKHIPRLSPFLIERHDVIEFMEQRLVRDTCDTQRLFLIYGMGGSGKTQTAAFFARRNKNRCGSSHRSTIEFVDQYADTNISSSSMPARSRVSKPIYSPPFVHWEECILKTPSKTHSGFWPIPTIATG